MVQSVSVSVVGKKEWVMDKFLSEMRKSPLYDITHRNIGTGTVDIKQRAYVVLFCHYHCLFTEEPGNKTSIQLTVQDNTMIPDASLREQLSMFHERIAVLFGADISGYLTGERELIPEMQGMPDMETLARQIIEKGVITAQEQLGLAQYIYQKGGIEDHEVDLLFQVNNALREKNAEWTLYFVNAVSDYFYWRKGGGATMSEDEERQLIEFVKNDGRIDQATEMRILLNIIERVKSSSDMFHNFVLDLVARSCLESDENIYNSSPRQAGVIDEDDVKALRKVLYAPASDGEIRINRTEAGILMRLERETAGKANHPSWTDLYVKANAMFLLFKGNSPEGIDVEESRWLMENINPVGQLSPAQGKLIQYLKQQTRFFPRDLEVYLPQSV